MVEELIDRCDVITSASMAGSFKPILDSTNNIITRNPRVQERFDLPYLLRYKPVRMGADDGGLSLCMLMPHDNDKCDVKMPSLKGKSWAGANGSWVFYIWYNCEWELVNVYTHQRIPLPKISECPEVEHTDDLRTFKYDHGGLSSTEDSNLSSSQPLLELKELSSCCYLRQACCRPSWFDWMDIAQKSVSIHG